jgi:SAM-dependent methyltransferase
VAGCDVLAPPPPPPPFAFTLLDAADPHRLPYATGSQDVVSALMSLHHIVRPEATLDEMARVLGEDGVVVVREHDCEPPSLALLLDLMHGFYAMVWPRTPEMPEFAPHYSFYRTRADLVRLVEGEGGRRFRCVHMTAPLGAWRHYYAFFVKPTLWAADPDRVRRWFPTADDPAAAAAAAATAAAAAAASAPAGWSPQYQPGPDRAWRPASTRGPSPARDLDAPWRRA